MRWPTLASPGVTPTEVLWSDADQENYVNYTKSVTWTDASGAAQTCSASRVIWYVGPQAVLAYLSRYTHRVAISNSRLLAMDERGVTFRWKDYRANKAAKGRTRYKAMTLDAGEFMRRFLLHVLPGGFHRIRHYGLFANSNRAANIARARELLAVPSRLKEPETSEAAIDQPRVLLRPCPCCGGRMIIIETFARGCEPKHQPETTAPVIRIDTS